VPDQSRCLNRPLNPKPFVCGYSPLWLTADLPERRSEAHYGPCDASADNWTILLRSGFFRAGVPTTNEMLPGDRLDALLCPS
jgi:hypothetical protein